VEPPAGSGKQAEVDLSGIRLLVLDVDGVLTDGTIIVHADGTESKAFNVHDGHGIKLWHRAGGMTAILSGRSVAATNHRAEQLGIRHVVQGQKRKLPAFERLLDSCGVSAEQVACIGDDVVDIPLIRRAGLGVAVANAVPELKRVADWVTQAPGGHGAVREVIEYILKRSNRWAGLMERYLQ